MELAVLSGRQGQLTPWRETPGAGEGTLILASSARVTEGKAERIKSLSINEATREEEQLPNPPEPGLETEASSNCRL